MEKNIIILQGISVNELLSQIDLIVEKRFNEKVKELSQKNEPKLLSRKETANYLQISLVTLGNWTRIGFLVSYRIGKRIFYKSDEVENSVLKRKFRV